MDRRKILIVNRRKLNETQIREGMRRMQREAMIMKPKLSLVEWVNQIQDNKLHHVGEYFCYLTGNKRFEKLDRARDYEYTSVFSLWLQQNDLSKDVSQLQEKFEIVRDWKPLGFFIRRKGVL